MKKILFISLAIVLALSVGLIGCEGEGPEPETPTDLRVISTVEPSTVGFPLDNREAQNFYTHPGCEALVKPAEDYWTSGDLVWILATSATPANNATEWTIELRTGVEFHDGSAWNASVCEFNIELVNEFDRRSTFDGATVDILGEHTIKLTFPDPYPTFLYDIFDSLYPISQAAFEANVPDPEAGSDADISWFADHCVGTGPFELESAVLDSVYTWVPFDNYWGDAALLDSIVVSVIPNATTAAALMVAGDADLYVHADPEAVETLTSMGGFESRTNNELSKYGVFPSAENVGSTIYNNLGIRQALQHAIDRVAIAAALSASGVDYDPAYQLPMAWDTDGYDPDWGEDDEPYDPDAAIALLEAHFGAGAGLDGEYFATTCYHEGEGIENTVALLVQDYLAAVNITMDIVVTSTRSMKTDDGWGADNLMLSNYSWSPLPVSSTLNWFNYGHDRMMVDTIMTPAMEAIYDDLVVTYDVSTLSDLHGDMMQETRDEALGVFITNEVYASVFVDNLDTHWMLPYDRYWFCNQDVFTGP